MKKPMLAAVIAVVLAAAPVMAKEGFYLGVNLLYHDFSGDTNDLDNGNGLGLRGGFGLNRYLAFEAAVFSTDHDVQSGGSTDFEGATIDAKLSFPLSGSQIAPYIFGGVGTYKLDNYHGASPDGTGGQLGIGIDIYLFPELNLNVGLNRRNITFDASPRDIDAKVTTLDFGITYHFL
jgi:hypothetical protein